MHVDQNVCGIPPRRIVSPLRVRLMTMLAVALGVLVLAPAASRAATITYDANATLIYSASPGETLNVYVGYEACVEATVTGACATFYGNTVTDASPAGLCADGPSGPNTKCILGSAGLLVVGGDGNDYVAVNDYGDNGSLGGFPPSAPLPIAIDGGAGNDTLVGGSTAETIHGGPGADAVIGSGGNDVLYGDDGNDALRGDGYLNGNENSEGGSDQLYGGPGDDTLTGDSINGNARIGADLLDGGPGTDTAYDDWYRFSPNGGSDQDPAPTVTFDGVANDGRPGEGDNVVNIEKVDTGYMGNQGAQATFVGSAGPDTFNLTFVNGNVSAGAGDDVITGSDFADTIDGGPGNDQISGGFDDDVITGGPGQDNIGGDRTASCFYGPIYGTCTTGSGNDTIYAQDGEVDTIDCGPGNDTAFVDSIDVVGGCETIHVTGASPPPPTCTADCSPPPPAGAKAKAKVKLTVPSQKLAKVRRAKAFRVTCRVPSSGKCVVKATITRRDAIKLHLKVAKRAKTYTLGSVSKKFKRAGSATLKLKLSAKNVRALRRAHKLTVTFTAKATGPKKYRSTKILSRRFK